MNQTLKIGAATICQNAGRLLHRCLKSTATKNDYKKYHGLIYASKYTTSTDLGTIQHPLKNHTTVLKNTPPYKMGIKALGLNIHCNI